jgi:hypothetical protein
MISSPVMIKLVSESQSKLLELGHHSEGSSTAVVVDFYLENI